jgi:hypothetical protein
MVTAEEMIAYETHIGELFNQKKIKAPIHLYSGNETKITEVFQNVDRENDWVCCTWRNHYQALLKSYVLPYEINQDISEGTRLNHPVYIQLGLLMFILNHCCNLYDKKQDNKKITPLLYIDFNPQTNFCLSHPCHMTSNAMTFLIPFEGTFDDSDMDRNVGDLEGVG